jgi:hypothetical protein
VRPSATATTGAPRYKLIISAVFEGDGATVYQYAAALGCEGIVSKRKGSRYTSGRSPDWIKTKNPDAPAVRRRGIGPMRAQAARSPAPVSRQMCQGSPAARAVIRSPEPKGRGVHEIQRRIRWLPSTKRSHHL